MSITLFTLKNSSCRLFYTCKCVYYWWSKRLSVSLVARGYSLILYRKHLFSVSFNNVFDGQLLFSESSCLYMSAILVVKVMALREI